MLGEPRGSADQGPSQAAPLTPRPGSSLSLGTFPSELTINRWREAIFFGISAISFSWWSQINMQMKKRWAWRLRAGEDASGRAVSFGAENYSPRLLPAGA